MPLALRAVEEAGHDGIELLQTLLGVMRAGVLRTFGTEVDQRELELQIAETLLVIDRTGLKGYLPLLLIERAGLARLRGDLESMATDLAEARRLHGEMGVTGWDDYGRSIEA